MKQGYAPDPARHIERQHYTSTDPSGPVTGAAKEAAQSAKEHAHEVGSEVMQQGRNLVGHVGERLSGEARSQNDRLVSGLRTLSDDLKQMGNGSDTFAGTMVQQISGRSRRAATYLEQHGPEGLLSDVQAFARRRPGAFLLGAAAAGFLVARLGKGLMSSPSSSSSTLNGTSRMTGVGMTPAGKTVPTATGMAEVPPDSLIGEPISPSPASKVRS